MTHKLAGTPVQEQDIIDVQTLVDAYFDNAPDITDPTQLVSFGTSGHRGTSLNGTFTDLHVAAITQAICDGRGQFGATGPSRHTCFISASPCNGSRGSCWQWCNGNG